MAAMQTDMAEVRHGQETLGGKIDQVVQALSGTDGRVAERAAAVKEELRQEAERKTRERSDMFKNGAALVGLTVTVVAAFCGPYLNKVNATADGIAAATAQLAGVSERVASDHAEIVRNRDSLDIAREKNRWQDDQILGLTRAQAYADGAARRPR